MEVYIVGLKQAIVLLATGNREVLEITMRTAYVSGAAVLISMLFGVPLGVALGLTRFPGRKLLVALLNTGMGLPPVTVGLFVWLLLTRHGGLLGRFELLLTPQAMIVAQVVIAGPIVAGLTLAAVQNLDPKLRLQSLSLGASRTRMLVTLLKEAQLPALAAVMAGFGGIISEVGASMMVGGNITGQTQVLTTAIVQYVGMGQIDKAMALSIILLVLAFSVTYLLTVIQQKGVSPWGPRVWK